MVSESLGPQPQKKKLTNHKSNTFLIFGTAVVIEVGELTRQFGGTLPLHWHTAP
jgi:hypothetical protein